MAEDDKFRRPEDPRDIDKLVDKEAHEQGSLMPAQEPLLEPPIRPTPLPRYHDNSDNELLTDDPGASASGYVSMLAKGQIGEIEPTSHRNIPMAREVPREVAPASMPPKLDPMRLPGPRPKPRRPWWWKIPRICYGAAFVLTLVGLWATVATVGIFTQQNLIFGFEWDNDGSQLLAILLLLCLPTAIIVGMVGLYIRDRLRGK